MEITIRDFEKMIGPAKQYADHIRDIETLYNNSATAEGVNAFKEYKEAVVDLFVKERFKFQAPQASPELQSQAGSGEISDSAPLMDEQKMQ